MPNKYQPDILSCLANLSSDEVFTPPEIANQMLDMLPQELFQSTETTFLDPCCKTGVFLREITKRLLEAQIPEYKKATVEIAKKRENNVTLSKQDAHFEEHLQNVLNHILTRQVYGIGITELTSLLTRRSLYCSKFAAEKYSVCTCFKNDDGNIRFVPMKHTWKNEKCIYCGASKNQYDRPNDLEQHSYEFIHTEKVEDILNMQFDVIIGNPPYQLNVGVEKENYAVPIYQKFVEQAEKLNPKYLTMIIPARWYAGGRGLDNFRSMMLHDNRLRIIHDYPNSLDCFPGVDIAGGICYFLWNRDNKGQCDVYSHKEKNITSHCNRPLLENGMDSFIRQNEAISIFRKVQNCKEAQFSSLVGPQTPFGLISSFRDFSKRPFTNSIKYYTYGFIGYISKNKITKNINWVKSPKVYISAAYGERGSYPYFFLGKPFYGEPNSCCSQTYLVIGPFESKQICENVMSYISTRFFRFMIMLKKNAQHNMSYVFDAVPIQDFSKPWTDEELYKKYKLSKKEISFIESMIKPMSLDGDNNGE